MRRTDLCSLQYNQITWPGTHNSGSGELMFFSGEEALPCFYGNQDMDYTEQLEFGIRWFDIDLCLVTEEEATESVPAGLWTCHSDAYSVLIDEVLLQIDEFLDYNNAEVVSLSFNGDYNHSRSKPIAEALNDLLVYYWGDLVPPRKKRDIGPLKMNTFLNENGEWPVMDNAIYYDSRVFVFLHETLQLGNQPWAHDTILHTHPIEVIKDSCDSLIDFTRGACDVCSDLFGVQGIGSLGNCIFETAEICNKVTYNVSRECFDLRMKYGKILNYITVDFPARSLDGLSVVDVANMLNDINVDVFLFNPPLDSFPNATDCYPGFVPTPSPSPLPQPTTYCEALTQISDTPLCYFQCAPNDACDKLICPIDLFDDDILSTFEMGIVGGCDDQPAEFYIALFSPSGGPPVGEVSANKTGVYYLVGFPLLIIIEQMKNAVGLEVRVHYRLIHKPVYCILKCMLQYVVGNSQGRKSFHKFIPLYNNTVIHMYIIYTCRILYRCSM